MISERAFTDAAQELNCELAAIKAVAEVESNGRGTLPNGEPKILFEAHKFSERTNGRYDVSHPRLSSPEWNRKLYVGGEKEHFRLQQAVKLDRTAALESTSWGMFQIMGFNWAACGFASLQDFINAMYAGEDSQLSAFVGFIKNNPKLLRAIQNKKWATFALNYNGKGYKLNKYDVKLEQAYKRFLN